MPFDLTTFRAVVSNALLVEMGLNEAQAIEIITRRRGLGKESKALAFKPRNKEHNMLIPRHCQKCSQCGRPYVDKDCRWNT